MPMTIEECEANINCCVRLEKPRGRNIHMGHGKIVGIQGNKVLVKPLGRHKKTEIMEPSEIRLWKSRIHEDEEIRMGRLIEDADIDPSVRMIMSGKNPKEAHANHPWAGKPQSSKKKKAQDKRFEAVPAKVLEPELISKKGAVMKKAEWIRKNCDTILDCLKNCTSEVFGQTDQASVELTDQILQSLCGDVMFLALENEVIDLALPLIEAFSAGEIDDPITKADLEKLFEERGILKIVKSFDPIEAIRLGNIDKKKILEALIGPHGFSSSSELATFVLKELRGKKS